MNATVKELKENMKSIRETLKRFEEAEKVIAKIRNTRTFDDAQQVQKEASKDIMNILKEMVVTADALGLSCNLGEWDTYHRVIEEKY